MCSTVALGALLSGCAGGANGDVPGKVDVVASTDVWGSVAAVIGGPRVSVTSIINDAAQDPHSFEASTRTLLTVRDADLLVENGGGYDDFMTQMISTSGSQAPVVDAVKTSGLAAASDQDFNEHVWYDLPTVAKVADAIAARLGDLEPRHAAEFTANAKTFDNGVERLIGDERKVRAAADGVGVGITEPVPLYLLQAMGLHNLTPVGYSRAVEESGDVSAQVLAETLALYTQHRVAALVYNAQTSGPVTAQVEDAARAAGVPVVPVTETLPDGTSYLTWMSHTIARVGAAVTRP
jgi:zinc/manganese transport system substrate-binding protein